MSSEASCSEEKQVQYDTPIRQNLEALNRPMPSRFDMDAPATKSGTKSALFVARRSGQNTPSRPAKLHRRVTFMDICHYSVEEQQDFIERENNKVKRNYTKELK